MGGGRIAVKGGAGAMEGLGRWGLEPSADNQLKPACAGRGRVAPSRGRHSVRERGERRACCCRLRRRASVPSTTESKLTMHDTKPQNWRFFLGSWHTLQL